MKDIQMVDLKGQYANIKDEVNQALLQAIDQAAFINGPEVKAFAEEFALFNQVKHVIPCGNGTDALQIALMGLGLEPGDEVIVPTFTYVASAEVIALLGLKPIFVDVDPEYFTISVKEAEAKLSKKTRAIMPVHLYGQCAPMKDVLALAKAYNLAVIEDTAQAVGAQFTFPNSKSAVAGTIGDVGCTSFFPSKNLGCYGDGGAMMTNDDSLAEQLRMIANHGQKKKYYHDVIGVNSRLDTLQAAILRIKLKHLADYTANRQKAASYYDSAFSASEQISIPARAPYSTHVFHQYTLKVGEGISRDDLKAYLAEEGIPAMVYYPVPLHLQKAYQHWGAKAGDYPVAEKLCEQVISLPMHTELSKVQQDYIIDKVQAFVKQNG